tara:strand:- start:410 stop:649 length:240 start_codon:yes stop_codon:yes gene_type:complete
LKIKKEYEDKTLHIARHHWSRAVVTYVIENNKQITTPISATDAKTLGMYDVFEKNNTIKNMYYLQQIQRVWLLHTLIYF